MHVQHLSVTAFQGIPSFDGPLAPLTLFVGDNGAGKTSLQQALRYALTGEVDRVALKKDYPLLVTEGARKSTVRVIFDTGEDLTATLPTGKHHAPIEPGSPAALALDPAAFMRLPEDSRRTLLYDLAGDMGDVFATARKRLTEALIPAPMLEEALTNLRAGFPAAFQQATARASEMRASWRGVTGEAYGVQKAEDWRPSSPVTAPTPEERAAAQEALDDATQALQDASERLGQATVGLDPETRRQLKAQADTLPGLKENVAAGEAEIADLREKRQALSVKAEQSAGILFECPCCEAKLRYAGGVVTERTVDTEEATDASQQIIGLGRELAGTEQKLGTVRARLTQAQAAADRLAAAGEGSAEDDSALRTEVAAARADVDAAHAAVQALRQRDEHVARLTQQAKDAASWHYKAKCWAEIAALMAPDGLPGELLGWALKPVNEALRHGPEGWPTVALRGDMTLTVNGRPYGLCSESEQWRADVLMATYLATRCGSRLVLADRMDVLDPGSRVPFLEWAADRSDAGVQFIVAATLQRAPALDYAQVYWVGAPTLERAA